LFKPGCFILLKEDIKNDEVRDHLQIIHSANLACQAHGFILFHRQ
jgi:hypothetical protein